MNDNAVFTRKRIPYRKVNSCSVIHLGSRQLYFNETATQIWELLDGQRSAAAIAGALSEAETSAPLSVPEATETLKIFLADLLSKDLLEPAEQSFAGPDPEPKSPPPAAAQETASEGCQYLPAKGAGEVKTTRDRIFQFYWDEQLIEKLHLELTYRCNLRCCHCYNNSHSGASRELTTSQWFSLLDDAAALGCYFLVFTGGEPFARRDIIEILQKACASGYAFRINTNGSMIRDHHIPLLKAMTPFLQGVDISIYGPDAEIHDKVTSLPGSYALTRTALDRLTEAGVPVVAKYVTMQMNFAGLQDFEKEMRANKVPSAINTGSMIPRTDRNPAPLAQLLSDEQYREMLRLRGHPTGGRNSTNCIPGWNRGGVTSDGHVTPCEWLGDLKLGNVRDTSLSEIWHGPGFRQLRESLVSRTRACSDCSLGGFCCSCPAHAYLETGDLFSCPPVQRHNAELCREFFTIQA